jgi:hypothetical protein
MFDNSGLMPGTMAPSINAARPIPFLRSRFIIERGASHLPGFHVEIISVAGISLRAESKSGCPPISHPFAA